jgi:hypothetical protein
MFKTDHCIHASQGAARPRRGWSARYAMGSGPVLWIGPAVKTGAKTGEQFVGQIGDNPRILSHFGVGNNAKNSEFAGPRGPTRDAIRPGSGAGAFPGEAQGDVETAESPVRTSAP